MICHRWDDNICFFFFLSVLATIQFFVSSPLFPAHKALNRSLVGIIHAGWLVLLLLLDLCCQAWHCQAVNTTLAFFPAPCIGKWWLRWSLHEWCTIDACRETDTGTIDSSVLWTFNTISTCLLLNTICINDAGNGMNRCQVKFRWWCRVCFLEDQWTNLILWLETFVLRLVQFGCVIILVSWCVALFLGLLRNLTLEY